MSSTPPPGDSYGQPNYGEPNYEEPNYGQQPAQPGHGQDPYAAGQGQQPVTTEPPQSVRTAVTLIWASIGLSVLSTILTFVMLDSIVDKDLEDA